jgi:hypothetical protein
LIFKLCPLMFAPRQPGSCTEFVGTAHRIVMEHTNLMDRTNDPAVRISALVLAFFIDPSSSPKNTHTSSLPSHSTVHAPTHDTHATKATIPLVPFAPPYTSYSTAYRPLDRRPEAAVFGQQGPVEVGPPVAEHAPGRTRLADLHARVCVCVCVCVCACVCMCVCGCGVE